MIGNAHLFLGGHFFCSFPTPLFLILFPFIIIILIIYLLYNIIYTPILLTPKFLLMQNYSCNYLTFKYL